MAELIEKKGDASELEQSVGKALKEIVDNAEESAKKQLSNLKIAGAKEIDSEGQKIVIVTVPYKQIPAYRNVSTILVPELEKKLNNSMVFIVGKRRAFPKNPVRGRRYVAIRPTGRTLRAVNENLLDDLVFPTSIVGKRVHYNAQQKQTTYVYLDPNDRTRVEERLHGFSIAYERLTGLKTVFEVSNH